VIDALRNIVYTGDKEQYCKAITAVLDTHGVPKLKYPIHLDPKHPYLYIEKYPSIVYSREAKYGALLQLFSLKSDEIPIMDNNLRIRACGMCRGVKGSCMFRAPYLKQFIGDNTLFILAVTIDYYFFIRSVSHNFTKARSNVITTVSLADKYSESIAKEILAMIPVRGKRLYLGNCAACKDCNLISTGKCAKPHERTISLEAVGVDIEALHMQLFNSIMHWYYKGTSLFPQYVTRYVGILSPDQDNPVEVRDELERRIEARPTARNVFDAIATPYPDNLVLEQQEVPFGYHKGSIQNVYRYNRPAIVEVDLTNKVEESLGPWTGARWNPPAGTNRGVL
jgi:hypothetical protein